MTAKSEWLNGFEAGKKSVSGGYRHRIQQLEAKLDEAEDEVFRLHNPHTGEECVCVICKPIRETIGERNVRIK